MSETDTIELTFTFRFSATPFSKGAEAYSKGEERDSNPYQIPLDRFDYESWNQGYDFAKTLTNSLEEDFGKADADQPELSLDELLAVGGDPTIDEVKRLAHAEGEQASRDGKDCNENPYRYTAGDGSAETRQHLAWSEGWCEEEGRKVIKEAGVK